LSVDETSSGVQPNPLRRPAPPFRETRTGGRSPDERRRSSSDHRGAGLGDSAGRLGPPPRLLLLLLLLATQGFSKAAAAADCDRRDWRVIGSWSSSTDQLVHTTPVMFL